jgi:hypothetical protein
MPRYIRDGAYYEFNRPNSHYEVGREIIGSMAQMDVTFGRDVYTARGSDAKSLAKKIVPMPPTWHPAHQANFFPHYYPGIGEYVRSHLLRTARREFRIKLITPILLVALADPVAFEVGSNYNPIPAEFSRNKLPSRIYRRTDRCPVWFMMGIPFRCARDCRARGRVRSLLGSRPKFRTG